MVTKELSRMNDYFARYLLGQRGNEPLLLSFINSVMRDSNLSEFQSVTIRNPYNLKEHAAESETIVDVKATMSSGETVIVEIQVRGNKAFFSRALEYWAKNYRSEKLELKNGEKVNVLAPVISINLLAFELFKSTELSHTTHMIHCCETGTVSTKDLLMHFIELPKDFCGVQEQELKTWLTYFGSTNFEKDKTMIAEKGAVFKKAVGDYEYFRSDKDLVSEYEKREIYISGEARMRQVEREEGRQEGIEQGREEGIEQGIVQVAKSALKEGLDITTIEKLTGLTPEEIRTMK